MEIKNYICHGPLLLVLRISRVLGIAPLTFGSDGIKLSRVYYIYSLIFITTLSKPNSASLNIYLDKILIVSLREPHTGLTTTEIEVDFFSCTFLPEVTILAGFVLDVAHPEKSMRARTSTSRLIWFAYQTVLTAVTVVGSCNAPTRCTCMLNTLHRIEKIKKTVEPKKRFRAEVIYIYAIIFAFLSTVVILSLFDFFQHISAAYLLNKEVRATSLFSFFYIEYVIELLLEFQFMLVVSRLTLVLKDVNEKLQNILQALGENKKLTTINNYMVSENTKHITYFEECTQITYELREKEWSENIMGLALVYEKFCELIRCIERGHGLVLLLLLQSSFLHFIMTPYYMINIHRVADEVASIGQQIAWFHFHAFSVVLIVEPCHRVQQEMNKTRSVVSKLLCRVRSRGSLAHELTAFFKTLTLDQPTISPFGMCVLERPLLITILGVVSAYLVPRQYFTIPFSKNINTQNMSILLMNDTIG